MRTPQALRRQRTTNNSLGRAVPSVLLEGAAAGAALFGVHRWHLGELGSLCPGVGGLCPSRVARAVGARFQLMHKR